MTKVVKYNYDKNTLSFITENTGTSSAIGRRHLKKIVLSRSVFLF